MNYLKIVAKGFENYTGLISMHQFKDGVSVTPLPRSEIDRLSATMQMVEILENGKEIQAGVAGRLVGDTAARAPVREATVRQTEAEKAKELAADAKKALKPGHDGKIYSADELEALVAKDGVKALRAVGEKWGVKARSIPELLGLIMAAQAQLLEKRNLHDLAEELKAVSEATIVGTPSEVA